MKNSYSVVSGGTTVFQDREKVEAFVQEVLRAYGYDKTTLEDEMMFSTEKDPSPSEEKQKLAHQLSNALETKLIEKIKNQGTEKMKEILMRHVTRFNNSSNAKDFTYERAKKLWQESREAQPSTST